MVYRTVARVSLLPVAAHIKIHLSRLQPDCIALIHHGRHLRGTHSQDALWKEHNKIKLHNECSFVVGWHLNPSSSLEHTSAAMEK